MGGHRQGPFSINNYLLFGNIFFPPMKATADVIVTGKISYTRMTLRSCLSSRYARPILIFALLMLYRLFVLLRTNARAILNRVHYLPFLFLCLIIVHLLIYSRQTGIDYGLGEWDYRYFMPVYIPLLYFAISALRVYGVFDKVKEVVTALTSCIVVLTPALIIGVCVFGSITGSNDFYTLCIICKILALQHRVHVG